MSQDGPLAGIRIIEVGHMLAGPYCGMLLADLGAEVIKVETGTGDIARHTGRHSIDGYNVYFASLNRNKKSVTLDLTKPQDRAAFERLASTSHALLTNLRPAAIRKLGLNYETLRAVNPDLVCVALTGFGLNGPFSEFPAYDYIIQAMAGVMMMTGDPGGQPVRAGYSVVDNSGGMMAALGLLAKLVSRKGGQVDISLYDTLLSQLNYLAAAWLNGGERPERHPSGGHNFFVPAQIFATADGHIAMFITHDSFWEILAHALGREDWLEDPRFATMAARSDNRLVVVNEVQLELARRTSQEWVDLLQPLGVVIAAVGTLEDALAGDQVAARDMVVSIATPTGVMRFTGNPVKIDGVSDRPGLPPRLGEHNDLLMGLQRAE